MWVFLKPRSGFETNPHLGFITLAIIHRHQAATITKTIIDTDLSDPWWNATHATSN
ncbi:hypothetical protein SLEP1_g59471 [Rubroshorea leprosula]|uniref:Uncharacterized protein n=1 Tax=Rubroshorea leprosula TaxID=152421 RepID=A0AAV5MSH8_9ROSI|nr:hypothetical protein SLEP1_g59471 [Rubroshorea leprosula]